MGGDTYGNEGGEISGATASASFITVADPFANETIMVKARGSGAAYPDATYKLRVQEKVPDPLTFDNGSVAVTDTNAVLGKFFYVDVPPGALGWDLRLINVTAGRPQLVVRRDGLPISLDTFGFVPATSTNWPSLARWVAGRDWTERTFSADNLINEDGRILAMGMGRPLEAGLYYVGVLSTLNTTNIMTYTVVSRGIGPGFAIPVVDLPFVGSVTNLALAPREAAYYRVVVPSNAPSWKVRLAGLQGESMLAIQSNAVPSIEAANLLGTVATGKGMQRLGNEHFLFLPSPGGTNIPAGTNFIVVISEGVNPASPIRIGVGDASYTLASLGAAPVTDLGLLTSEDLVQPDALEGGESKAYQFTVPIGMVGGRPTSLQAWCIPSSATRASAPTASPCPATRGSSWNKVPPITTRYKCLKPTRASSECNWTASAPTPTSTSASVACRR